MKLSGSVIFLTLSLQASTVACQLIVLPNFFQSRYSPSKPASNKEQSPIMNIPNIPNIVFPPSNDKDKDSSSGGPGDTSISDVIGKERVINIFAGFTRDIDNISNRLSDNNHNTTVLAPLNSELQKLPRKPWEDPQDYNELGAKAYEGQSGEDRAHRNLRRFVEAHVVPVSPWKEGEKVSSIGGGKLWWEEKDGKKMVCSQTHSNLFCFWAAFRLRLVDSPDSYHTYTMMLSNPARLWVDGKVWPGCWLLFSSFVRRDICSYDPGPTGQCRSLKYSKQGFKWRSCKQFPQPSIS